MAEIPCAATVATAHREVTMFAVLEHETGTGTESRGAAEVAVHWDFLIEIPGQAQLATWRLAANPVTHAEAVAAERIVDHRRAYLEYEGELSGARGRVRRVDRGGAVVHRQAGDELLAELRGQQLRGLYEISAGPADRLLFRHAAQPRAADTVG